MRNITVFNFGFDVCEGPVLVSQSNNHIFTDEEITSFKFNAFPESSTPLKDGAHIYTFKVNQYYCYTVYYSIPDKKSRRGYLQFSIVIATHTTYSHLFLALLESTKAVNSDPIEIYNLICHYLTLWESVLLSTELTHYELPLFNGSLYVLKSQTTRELLKHLMNDDHFYCPNSNFIGDDLTVTLSIDSIPKTQNHSADLTKLWEYSILGEPVLVLGATPSAASNASLSISSLSFPEPHSRVIPYITVTDSRFKELSKKPVGIVGTSNPIAPLFATNFPHVFRVGFSENNGFVNEQPKFIPSNPKTQKHSKNLCQKNVQNPNPNKTSINYRFSCYENTKALECAITDAIRIQISRNFCELMCKKFDILELSKQIDLKNVALEMFSYDFASKLVSAPIFNRILKVELQSLEAQKEMISLELALFKSVCVVDIKNVCRMLVNLIKNESTLPETRIALKKQLKIVTQFIDWK